MRTEKSRMLLYIEFHKPQNPEHIENSIRKLVSRKQLPSIRTLMVGIDHKNMKVITPISVLINEENKSK